MGTRLKAGLLLAAMFVAGGVTGAAVMRAVCERALVHAVQGPPNEVIQRLVVWRLTGELHLTDAQQERVKAILAAHQAEHRALRRTIAPEVLAITKREEAEIGDAIDPAQRAHYDEIVAAWNASLATYMEGQ